MVDSAVTLSIGTELDLSGLQRDLAALKSQKFNFDFDADKIGRSFREANRQMQLKPRVDLSELHELNRLLDVKLNHVKKVQKYFDANPLKIKVNGSSLEITKALNSLKGGDFSVKTKADNQSVGFLRDISQNIKDVSKNTKQRGSFLGTIRTGFLEGIGANSAKRFSEGLTGTLEKQFNSSLNRIGEAVGQGIASTVKSSGRAVTKGVLGVDPKEFTDSIKVFFEEINDFIDLDEVKKTTDDLENAFADLLGTIASVDKNLDKIPQDIKNIALSFSKLREPYLDAFSERRKSKISKAAEATIEATTTESVDLDPTKEKLVIVSGGFAGKEGKTGQGLTEIIKKLTGDAAQFEAIANEFTDTLNSSNEGVIRWSAQAAQRLLEMTITKGYNPDAIVMAAKAVSAREQDPNIPIELVGYSAGGYVVQQAMQILKELGLEGVRGTALGTPIELAQGQGGLTQDEFQAFLGLEDGLQAFVEAAEMLRMGSEEKATVAETVSGHNIEAYLADPRVQARLAGSTPMSLKDRTAFDIVRLKKDASAIVSDALEGMQSLSESMGNPIMVESFNAYLTSLISGTQKVSESLQNISEKTPIEEVRQEAEDIRDALLLLQNLMVEIVRLDIPKAEISRDAEDLEGTIEDLLAFAEIQKEIRSKARPQGKYSIPQQKKEKLPLEVDLPVAIANPASLDLSPVASLLEAAQEAEIGLSRFGKNLQDVGSIDVSGFIEATTKLENSMISGSEVIATSFSELSQKIESVEVSSITSSVSDFSSFIDETSNAVLKLKAVIEDSLVPSIEQIGKANILTQADEPSISESQQEKALSVVPALTEIAKVAQEAAQSLDKVGTELDAAFKALDDINESTLETFSTTMEEFKAFLMDSKNIVLSSQKKGQPDLRGAAKTLGVPTRNPATKKPFTKEELTDYLLGNFDINTVKDAIAKVGAGLPQINENIGKELARQYEAIDKAIKEIDQTPIEQQLRLWDELEAKLIKIAEEMNRLQREYSFSGDVNQAFQGRKQAFEQQYFTVKKGQELAKGTPVGKDIAIGAAVGIEQNKDQPIAAIQKMAMEMIEVAKDEFGIQSPSKVFKAIGRDIIRGLQIGGDVSPYVDSLIQSFESLKRQLQGQQSALGKQLQIETDEDSIRYIKAQIAVIDEWKKELLDVNASVELLKNSMGDLSNETTKKLFADLTKQAVVLGQKIEQVTNPRKTPSSTKSAALMPVQSRMATTSAIPQFNLDAVFEAAEEAQQQLSETEFEIGDLNADNWIDSIAEVITGIKGITSKSWKEIGSEFAKNFKTEGIKKAFGELQETVKGSFSRIFAGAFGNQGAQSRFIQGVIGNLTIGLTQLTNVLATRLDSILTAVNETLNGALEGISNFSENITQNLGKIALIAVQAFALVGIVRGMTALGQAAFQTALEVEQLTRSLSFSSAEGGIATLDMIKQKAEELSLSFVEAAQGYSQLAASTLGTSLESQTEDIFTGVSTAIAARGLGKEQQSRAFLAISQIASKGRVSLEELNGQLGEALPGALQTAARALGVTSAELIKLVSTGQVTADEFLPKFADQLALEAGSSVAAAANTATAQLVKFENRLTNIRAELGKGILTPLTAVLPIVNGALKILADNMTLVLGVVASISAVIAFNLAKALILVAAQFKLVNLALATFGITLEQQVNAVTGKTTVKVIGLQGAIMGLGNAFKMMALQAAPLLILATVVSRIQAAAKPLNEDIAKTNKEFVSAINNAKRLRAEREREKRKQEQEEKEGKDKNPPISDYQLFGELYGGKNQQRMLGIGVALNKFLPFMQFGRNKEITQVAETFLDIQRQARLAKEDIDLAIEGYSGLTEAQKQQLQENEKATRLKGTELQVASATGLDTTQLKADLEGLRQKREEILNTIQGYDQLVAASNRVDASIKNLNTRRENEQIDRQVYNEELARLTEQKERLSVLLDDYAEGTKQITNNVRALASELQKVSVEFQNAQLNAERTASMAQMELIRGRLSGKVSAPEFARQQTAIANQQTVATKDAAIAARDAALKAIQSIDNTTLGLELETAFGDQLATVLSDGTVEAVEAARARLSQDGKELDPAIETALNSIQEYIGLRNQAFELEKQTLEQQLENRQQAADILQQEIDLLNERAQFEIDTKSLQAEIEQMRQMGAGRLSEFQAQQLSSMQEATAKRQDAARLKTSATEATLAAQSPDILPEARQRFLRDAQRQNLEAQLKEQEALYAESQARIARELRPLDLAKEQIDINLNAAQQQASIQMNRAMASSALSSFQKEMMQGGSAINQLLFEAQNESFLAQMERGKAGIKGLSPDKRKELLISAQQRENLAEQKRSEAELQQVELQRNKQIRDFELATKQAAIANDQFYQSRKNAILAEQANAKTADQIATASIIAQKKQLDLEIEYTKRKLVLNQQQLASNESLYRRGIIDIDTYNENYAQLTEERLNLQENATNQQIQLNQQEIDNFQKLADQLKSVNTIREAVFEAQIKGQERATQAVNVYGDVLSKQGEIIQANAKIQQQAGQLAIQQAEQGIQALDKSRGIIESLRSTFQLPMILTKDDQKLTEKYRKDIESLIEDFKDSGDLFSRDSINFDMSKISELDPIQLSELRRTLKQAMDLGIKPEDLGVGGLAAIADKIEERNLDIAKEKAALLQQEQETQKQLLALEIERNKIAAQTQIRESEIAALRARNAMVTAKFELGQATTAEERIQAELAMLMAQDEFNAALSQIDIAKQNAVIGDRLAQLQTTGLAGEQSLAKNAAAGEFANQFAGQKSPYGFTVADTGMSLDPAVQQLATLSDSLKNITDFSKYESLLAQLDNAAKPLENQVEMQQRAIQASDRLATGIESLNAKIERLVTTLGRPNVTVGGGTNMTDVIKVLGAVN